MATAKLNHAIPKVESVLPITIAAIHISVAITVNASLALTTVKLVTPVYAAVSSITLALTGFNAAKKPILEEIASLNAKEK